MKLLRDICKRIVEVVMIFAMVVGLSQYEVYSIGEGIIPDTGITQTYDLSSGDVTINSDGTYVINQSVAGVTRHTITINSNATIYLNGVNIEVLKPVDIYDNEKPNPININGLFTVKLHLVDGTTNRLASEEGTIVFEGIRNGSGKAALRVPEGATLNIYGNSGVLNATGAQGKNISATYASGGGGAAIGGNGGVITDSFADFREVEASGFVNIYGGVIEAVGGASMGYHGQGGNAIGAGGMQFLGTPTTSGSVNIYGGNVNLTGGFGTWSQPSGYAVAGDLHFYGGKLVAKSAPQGNTMVSPLCKAPLTFPTQYMWRLNSVDLLEMSNVSTYTYADSQRYVELQEDFSGPYYVNIAKTAAQNASYLDTTQAIATSETIIVNTLKEVAELAVNNDEITVSVNKVTYVLPTAGTSANPLGTDGSFTFTITVTHGEYILTTDEKTIVIVATAFDGVSDVDAVAAAKLAVQNASYLDTTQAVAISETVIKYTLKAVSELAINNESITVTINRITYVLPVAGTSANPLGVDGSYTFTVSVSKGDQTLTSDEDTIAIIATAYEGVSDVDAVAAAKALVVDGSVNVDFKANQLDITSAVQAYVNELIGLNSEKVNVTVYFENETEYRVVFTKGSVSDSKNITMTINEAPDPDIAIVEAAKAAVQAADYLDTTQAVATSETIIKDVLKLVAELAVNNDKIDITINKISYDLPTAGTSANPLGVNGSYTFSVTVSKGDQTLTSDEDTIAIIATSYDGVSDVDAVAAIKTLIADGFVNVDFNASQFDITSAVQVYVNELIGLNPEEVSVTVYFESATEYRVVFTKGSVSDSKIISMIINEAPDPNIAIVEAAKAAVQAADYSNTTQAVATSETIIKDVLKLVAELAVNNEKVDITINKISYTLPAAGTSANPTGVNGSYTFTVTVSKGDQTLTSDEDTITIIATAYEGVSDVDAVAAAKAAVIAASYLDTTQAIATTEEIINNTLKAIAKLAVNNDSIVVTVNKVSYVLPVAGTSANLSGTNGSYTFTVTVSKGKHTLTTDEKRITIKATHINLNNPDIIVEHDSNVVEFEAAGLDDAVVFSEEERVHEVFVKLIFSVLERTNIPTEDKVLIDNFIKNVLSINKAELFVVDISLFKIVGDTSTAISNPLKDITISFVLPEAFRNVEFNLIRVHGDEVEVLEYSVDKETFVVTFKSGKFSTFSLVSELEEEIVLPETSDSRNVFNWVLLLLGFALLIASIKFDKKNVK